MVTNVRRWSLGVAVAGLILSSLPASANDTEGVVRLGDHQPQATRSAGVIRISDKFQQMKSVFRGQTPCDDNCLPSVMTSAPVAPPMPADDDYIQPEGSGPKAGPPQDPGSYNPPAQETPAADTAADGVEGVSYEDCADDSVGTCYMGNSGGYAHDYSYAQCEDCRHRRCHRHPHAGSPYSLGAACSKFGASRLGQFWASQAAMYRARNRYSSMLLEEAIEADCQEKHEWLRCKFGYFVPTGCCGKGCPPMGHYSMVYPADPNHFDQRDGQVYAAQGYGGPVSVPLAPNVHHTYNYGWGVPSSRLTPVSHPTH